jgi:streptogramin lyase
MSGQLSGELWEWHALGGWTKVPGIRASGANGVEISADERWIYFNAWGTQSVVRLSRGLATPQRTEMPVGSRPDNVHWAPDGRLLEGGQTEHGYRVVKIDPESLQVTQLLARYDTAMFQRGTVAAQVGAQYWVGSSRTHAVAVFYDAR